MHGQILQYKLSYLLPTHRGTGSLLVTVAAAGDVPQGGIGGALTNQISETAQAAGIQVEVEVTRYGEYNY